MNIATPGSVHCCPSNIMFVNVAKFAPILLIMISAAKTASSAAKTASSAAKTASSAAKTASSAAKTASLEETMNQLLWADSFDGTVRLGNIS